MFDLEALKNDVAKLLVTEHDLLVLQAAEAVEDSVKNNASIWHENSDPAELANVLAGEDDDE